MDNVDYLIWLIATAAMVVIVLTVGTLAAAELIPRRKRIRASGAERRRAAR